VAGQLEKKRRKEVLGRSVLVYEPSVALDQVSERPESAVLICLGHLFNEIVVGPIISEEFSSIIQVKLSILGVAVVLHVEGLLIKLSRNYDSVLFKSSLPRVNIPA